MSKFSDCNFINPTNTNAANVPCSCLLFEKLVFKNLLLKLLYKFFAVERKLKKYSCYCIKQLARKCDTIDWQTRHQTYKHDQVHVNLPLIVPKKRRLIKN